MPFRSGRSSERRPNVVASAMKPMPVMSQVRMAAPGAAAREMSVESANTPDPMEELTTRAISPKRLIPLRGAACASVLVAPLSVSAMGAP